MQKVFNISLAILILFQGMFAYIDISFELEEIHEDFIVHQAKYADDFTTFLSKHFGDLKEEHQAQHQEEHQEHKHHNEMELNTHFDYFIDNLAISIPKKIIISTQEANYYYQDLFSNFEKQKIFQPPQV
jgi:ABC-type Zn2+ transport system substrate-binding protein/surface adhesin